MNGTPRTQQTIFLTITRGSAARSFLRSDFLKTLLAQEWIRVVILAQVNDRGIQDYFRKEFTHPRVAIEEVDAPRYGKVRKFFIQFFSGLLYSKAEYRHLKYGGIGRRKKSPFLLFLVQHATYTVLDKLIFLRRIARFLEKYVIVDHAFGDLFEKYKPDLVFCTTIYGTLDVAILKEAYYRKIPTMSTPKSWDTVTRQFFRFPSEKIIVANQWMKDIIAEEQLLDPNIITVAGLIQFDVYGQKAAYLSRRDFCERCGLDPNKPIVLFAPEGLLTGDDETYVRELLEDATFLDSYSLIIRPHFTNIAQNTYEEFRHRHGVYIDDQNLRVTNMFHDQWDPTPENADWQAEVIHASCVVVCFMSTMVIDAHILDKPVIAIKYEPQQTTRVVPIDLLYTFRHIEAVLEDRSLFVAHSKHEVRTYIDTYRNDLSIHRVERARVVKKFAGVVDGKAGERTAQVVLQHWVN